MHGNYMYTVHCIKKWVGLKTTRLKIHFNLKKYMTRPSNFQVLPLCLWKLIKWDCALFQCWKLNWYPPVWIVEKQFPMSTSKVPLLADYFEVNNITKECSGKLGRHILRADRRTCIPQCIKTHCHHHGNQRLVECVRLVDENHEKCSTTHGKSL